MADQIDRGLKRLATDRVDLLQLHSCTEAQLRQGDVIDVIRRARDAGKTRFIGYSGDGAAAMHAVESGAFDTLQISVSIADQESIGGAVPAAKAKGMGVIAGNVPHRERHLEGNVQAGRLLSGLLGSAPRAGL